MLNITFACPNCTQHIEAGPGYAGLQIACPTCGKALEVPGKPDAPAPPPVSASKRIFSFVGIGLVLLGVGGYFGWSLVKRVHGGYKVPEPRAAGESGASRLKHSTESNVVMAGTAAAEARGGANRQGSRPARPQRRRPPPPIRRPRAAPLRHRPVKRNSLLPRPGVIPGRVGPRYDLRQEPPRTRLRQLRTRRK